jgi:hypothetical protein
LPLEEMQQKAQAPCTRLKHFSHSFLEAFLAEKATPKTPDTDPILEPSGGPVLGFSY